MVIYCNLFVKVWDRVPWTPLVSLYFIWFLILSSVSDRVACLMFQSSWKCLFLFLWKVAPTIFLSLICPLWFPHLSRLNYFQAMCSSLYIYLCTNCSATQEFPFSSLLQTSALALLPGWLPFLHIPITIYKPMPPPSDHELPRKRPHVWIPSTSILLNP